MMGKDSMPLKSGWLTGGWWYFGGGKMFYKKRLRTSFVVCLTVFDTQYQCSAWQDLTLFV